jgi:hypothetical protein
MATPNLLNRIAQKGSSKEQIADEVAGNPSTLSTVFTGLNSDKAPVKYGCAKILRLISEKWPAVLYSRTELVTRLLDGENTFLRCDAAHILANLAPVDTDNKFEEIFERYFAPISGPALVPAACIITCAARIALAKPALTARIARELLRVEKAKYATAECRNVALGHAIESFDLFYNQIENQAPVARLIRRQLRNRRPATSKKAEAFLKKHGL